jgi:hypothetical protein
MWSPVAGLVLLVLTTACRSQPSLESDTVQVRRIGADPCPACFPAAPFNAHVQEQFHEELLVRPLQSGHLLVGVQLRGGHKRAWASIRVQPPVTGAWALLAQVHFHFMHTAPAQRHHLTFPKAISQLSSAVDFRELELTFTHGRWVGGGEAGAAHGTLCLPLPAGAALCASQHGCCGLCWVGVAEVHVGATVTDAVTHPVTQGRRAGALLAAALPEVGAAATARQTHGRGEWRASVSCPAADPQWLWFHSMPSSFMGDDPQLTHAAMLPSAPPPPPHPTSPTPPGPPPSPLHPPPGDAGRLPAWAARRRPGKALGQPESCAVRPDLRLPELPGTPRDDSPAGKAGGRRGRGQGAAQLAAGVVHPG